MYQNLCKILQDTCTCVLPYPRGVLQYIHNKNNLSYINVVTRKKSGVQQRRYRSLFQMDCHLLSSHDKVNKQQQILNHATIH